MAASASLSFEEGMRTSSCIATLPLRMRVSMSAIGSVIVIAASPARLGDAGDLAGVRHVAEADAAEPELAVHRLRSPALPAARVGAHLVLGLPLLLLDQCLLGHYFLLPLCCGPRRFFLGAGVSPRGPSSPGRRNGKPKASRNALPSSLVRAVVTIVMSMPRVVSIRS